ncbi:heterokaryon incompatibility protein-domain-containing protein [Thelonectria olida]|uniref:Heterokaryon incompatibility protein-domain-containing protein n=1 Tax=Thelonectria olida TaxID=1576542 RepID=A0A9P9APR7_9HYPO|nr:heterokaryon incompatibility protein-domain-containing protein [Thelonectria olida]
MRLLNSASFEVAEFVGDDIPPYAILSHTWDFEEVTLSHMLHQDYDRLKGFTKLEACCAQAAQDGLSWVWIDTCCIDKSSSAELSEAINSMYGWYHNADVCYVYLYDVPPLDSFLDKHLFQKARWFTRGWCLQELIAPREVEFYAQDWTELGTKWSLQEAISDITSIPAAVLLHERRLSQFPLAQRMSWASKRNTTREEDMAYCLFGIFDINMPLLYGEGRRAFIRLQQEIMKQQVDYSIFLWRPGSFHDTAGLLCDSPHCFPIEGVPIRSGGFCRYSDIALFKGTVGEGLEHTRAPEITPWGLQMTVQTKSSEHGFRLAWLYLMHNDYMVCIFLSPQQPDHKYYRARVGYVEVVSSRSESTGFQAEYMCMAVSTDLSIPRIPLETLDVKLWLNSTADEHLSILNVHPKCDLQLQHDGSYATELHLLSCPEFFTMVFGVQQGQSVYRFVAAFYLFHGPWACKIRKFVPGVPLEEVAGELSKVEPSGDESDRAISLLPSGTYVTVSSKRRARSSRCYLYVSLMPARPRGTLNKVILSMPTTFST